MIVGWVIPIQHVLENNELKIYTVYWNDEVNLCEGYDLLRFRKISTSKRLVRHEANVVVLYRGLS